MCSKMEILTHNQALNGAIRGNIQGLDLLFVHFLGQCKVAGALCTTLAKPVSEEAEGLGKLSLQPLGNKSADA